MLWKPMQRRRRELGSVRAEPAVDLALVLAGDASGSISEDQFTLQLEGHAVALESDAVVSAIRAGPLGRIGSPWLEALVTAVKIGLDYFLRPRKPAPAEEKKDE